MAEYKILSAPVVVAPSDDSPVLADPKHTADILGFLDVRDVLSNFLRGMNSGRPLPWSSTSFGL